MNRPSPCINWIFGLLVRGLLSIVRVVSAKAVVPAETPSLVMVKIISPAVVCSFMRLASVIRWFRENRIVDAPVVVDTSIVPLAPETTKPPN